MPEKDGAEEKTTKSVVNKKQKQMMGEEGYDVARDEGRVKPSKDKKDGTTMTPSKEMEKLRKVNKGPSALERVKADIEKRYGKGAIMNVKKKEEKKEDTKEELDLTMVAEAFGGYIVEKTRKSAKSLTGNIPPEERGVQPDAENIMKKRIKKAQSQQQDFSSKMREIEGDPQTKKIKAEVEKASGQKTREFTQTDKNVTRGNELKQSPVNKKPRTTPFKSKKTLSPEVQKKVDAVKRDIDTRELINPDRRSRKRVSPSGTKYKTPSVKPKVPKFEKTPIKVTKPSNVKLPQGFKDFDRKLKSTRQSFARQRVGQSARTKNVIKNLTKGGKDIFIDPPIKPTKATIKTIGKVGGRKLAKTGVKIGAKALGKTALKQIPFLGPAIAGAEAVGRFASGDAVGAGIALVSAIPGLGIGADAANAARDIRRATKLARKAKTLTKVTRTGRSIKGANVIKRFKRSKTAKVPKFLQTKKGKLAAQVGGAVAVPTAGGLIKRSLGGARKAGDAVGHVGRRSAGSM